MDFSAIRILPLGKEDDLAYWLTKTPQERLAAVHYLGFPEGSIIPNMGKVITIRSLKDK